MFTGLIEEIGKVIALDVSRSMLRIAATVVNDGTKLGDSIAVCGVCLTVTGSKQAELQFHVSRTTQDRTLLNPRGLHLGDRVNLERAMPANGRFGGHFVTGHVDAVARVISVDSSAGHMRIEFSLPEEIKTMIAARGSVSVDGVSLTVAAVQSRSFVVAVIPETLGRTTLGACRAGDSVHIEADFLARYAARVLESGRMNHEVR